MTDKRDVTGIWYGSFAGAGVVPNRFIATLHEQGGHIAGTTTEPDDLGEVALLHADISGVREGAVIGFVKQYDGAAHCAHAVDYSGAIDAEGTEIAGDWRFADYSGQFVMRRERFDQELLAEEQGIALDAEIDAR